MVGEGGDKRFSSRVDSWGWRGGVWLQVGWGKGLGVKAEEKGWATFLIWTFKPTPYSTPNSHSHTTQLLLLQPALHPYPILPLLLPYSYLSNPMHSHPPITQIYSTTQLCKPHLHHHILPIALLTHNHTPLTVWLYPTPISSHNLYTSNPAPTPYILPSIPLSSSYLPTPWYTCIQPYTTLHLSTTLSQPSPLLQPPAVSFLLLHLTNTTSSVQLHHTPPPHAHL